MNPCHELALPGETDILNMRLRKILTTPIAYGLRSMGYYIAPYFPPSAFPHDFDKGMIPEIVAAKRFSMTSVERLVSLCESTRYLVENRIPGDIVECGVWKGGSMMVIARTLVHLGSQERHLHLFDTFEGMSKPTDADVSWDGKVAQDVWAQNMNPDQTNNYCFSPLEDVKRVMYRTGYDQAKIHFVKGKVEDTLPAQAPAAIALLRLDTDWYESTKHELIHLFPRLTRGGIVIFDDYDCWKGAKRAVDEYMKEVEAPLFLHRIDNEARCAVKL